MKYWAGIVWACFFLSSCTIPSSVVLLGDELSEEIAWVAVLDLDAQGGLVSASGLVPRENGVARLLSSRTGAGERWAVVGFREETLRTVLPELSADVLYTNELRLASQAEAALPAPDYSGLFEYSGEKLAGAAPSFSLTADWLPECPSIFAGFEANFPVDVRCAIDACNAEMVQSGCALVIDLRGCGFGELLGAVAPNGDLAFAPSGLGTCREGMATAPASLAIECEGSGSLCRIDAYPRAEEISIELSSQTVIQPGPTPGDYYRTAPGYLADLVVLEDRLVVLDHGGELRFWFDCASGSQLFRFFERDSLAPMESAAAPACSTVLVEGLSEGEFFVVHGGADHLISRVRADGMVLETATVSDPLIFPEHRVSQLNIHPVERKLSLVYSTELQSVPMPLYEPVIAVLDADSLASGQLFSPPLQAEGVPDTILTAGEGAPGELWSAGSTMHERLRGIGLTDAALKFSDDFWSLCSNSRRASPSVILRHATSGKIIIGGSSPDTSPMFVAEPDRSRCEDAVYYLASADTTGIVPHPADDNLMIAAMLLRGAERRSVLSYFEVGQARYLPMRAELGVGPAAHLAVADGALYFLLPWTAELKRARFP